MLETWGAWEIGGVRFSVRGDDLELGRPLLRRWSRLTRVSAAPPALRYVLRLRERRPRLLKADRQLFESDEVGEVLDALELDVTHTVIEQAEAVPLHAAGVVRSGTAWLLLGPSGAGKSTLAAGMLERGVPLLSDEQVFVTGASRGFVASGYPRALVLGEPPVEREIPAAAVAREPMPVAGLVALAGPRSLDAAALRLGPAEALAHLTAALLRPPRPADLARLSALAAAAPAWSLRREGVAAALEELEGLV